MKATPNSTKPVLQSITIELAPEEAVALEVIVGTIGHSQVGRLLNTGLDFDQIKRLRDLSTSALWEALKSPLREHGLGNFDEHDLDERERLNLQYLGVLD